MQRGSLVSEIVILAMCFQLKQLSCYFIFIFIFLSLLLTKEPQASHAAEILKELCHGDFQVFWSKLPQIITEYFCRKRNTYRTLRGRYQVNFRRKNKP